MKTFKLNTSRWHVIRINFLMAGVLVLTSVFLSLKFDERWFFIAGFVALMQIVFALTGYCPSSILLVKLGVPKD